MSTVAESSMILESWTPAKTASHGLILLARSCGARPISTASCSGTVTVSIHLAHGDENEGV